MVLSAGCGRWHQQLFSNPEKHYQLRRVESHREDWSGRKCTELRLAADVVELEPEPSEDDKFARVHTYISNRSLFHDNGRVSCSTALMWYGTY